MESFDCIIKCAGPADAQEIRRLYYTAKNLRSALFIRPHKVAAILEELKKPSSFASRRERLQHHIARIKARRGPNSGECKFLEERLAALDKEQRAAGPTGRFGTLRLYPAMQAIEQMRAFDFASIEKNLFDQLAYPKSRYTVSLDIETHGGPKVKTTKKVSLTTAALQARCAVNEVNAQEKAVAKAKATLEKAQLALHRAQQDRLRTARVLEELVNHTA